MATVDRDYGILNKVFHHITHVAHQWTHAMEHILGEYYQFDDTPFYKALSTEAKECLSVEPDEGASQKGVYWYWNKF